MLELYTPDYEILNTKDRITIDLIKDGEEFLKKFDIDQDFLLDTVSIIYRYLRIKKKIPHTRNKFNQSPKTNQKYTENGGKSY